MTDSSVRLPLDPLGKPLMAYDFDFDAIRVAMYKDDGAGDVELWDGTVDVSVTGDFYLNLDDVETLLTDIKTAVEIIDNFISGARGLVTEDNSASILAAVQDQRDNYKYTGFLEDGTDVYVAFIGSSWLTPGQPPPTPRPYILRYYASSLEVEE